MGTYRAQGAPCASRAPSTRTTHGPAAPSSSCGFASFSAFADASAAEAGRASAFHPGGRYATLLAERPLFAKVGDTVFVHGGILPKHLRYGLDRMNDEVDAWLLGRRDAPPGPLIAEDGPLWTRAYSTPSEDPDCDALDEALSVMGAKRMVVPVN
jgi:hypothetical protein